jgi:hypothetical protein
MVEVVSGIAQGYEQLALYKDVLDDRMAVEAWRDDLEGRESIGRQYVTSILKTGSTGTPSPSSFTPPLTRDFMINAYLDEEMAELIAIKDRAELEHVYGVPPPVSLSFFLRVIHFYSLLACRIFLSSSPASSGSIHSS